MKLFGFEIVRAKGARRGSATGARGSRTAQGGASAARSRTGAQRDTGTTPLKGTKAATAPRSRKRTPAAGAKRKQPQKDRKEQKQQKQQKDPSRHRPRRVRGAVKPIKAKKARNTPGDSKAPEARKRSRERDALKASPMIRALVMVVAFAGMVAFAVVLAKLTLMPSAASVRLTHTNLRPGDSIRAYLKTPGFRDTVKQIGGNTLLGIPFGLLLPVLWPWARGVLRVVFVTALVMMQVELVQGAIITGRAFDIDDVILNTAGAFIGYLTLGHTLGRAVHPDRHRWWHRFTRKHVR